MAYFMFVIVKHLERENDENEENERAAQKNTTEISKVSFKMTLIEANDEDIFGHICQSPRVSL